MGSITINLEKAKAIKQERIAQEADIQLKQVQADYITALINNDEKQKDDLIKRHNSLVASKNDPQLAAIRDVASLKNYTPQYTMEIEETPIIIAGE